MTPRERPVPTNRRLHVLHAAVPTGGGLATVTTSYVRDQVERGWHVTLACPSAGGLGYAAREAGATVTWWEAAHHATHAGAGLVGELLALQRIVAESRPDVVHLHGRKAGLAGRLVVRGEVATVLQPHGWSALAPRGGPHAISPRWERLAARWTTELVCVSVAERRLAAELGVRTPAVVLPNGVDLSRFEPAGPEERLAARRRLGLPDAPTAVCIGALSTQKGQRDLLRAWPRVRAAVPGARLVLVGDGPDRESVARLAAEAGEVVLAGARDDVPAWLAAADVVVVPSRWEGMALVPLEAMATARSVVATAVDGLVESIPDDAGALVPRDDPDALVGAVVGRLRDPGLAEREGWDGRAHVETHHDMASSAHELARVYLRLVAARRAR